MNDFLSLFKRVAKLHKLVLYSWGIHGIVKNQQTVTFIVNGFKYQGSITLYQEGNKFFARLNERGTNFCDDTLDGLIKKIDSAIEVTNNYNKDVISSLNT